jgi:hypothetical protein
MIEPLRRSGNKQPDVEQMFCILVRELGELAQRQAGIEKINSQLLVENFIINKELQELKRQFGNHVAVGECCPHEV